MRKERFRRKTGAPRARGADTRVEPAALTTEAAGAAASATAGVAAGGATSAGFCGGVAVSSVASWSDPQQRVAVAAPCAWWQTVEQHQKARVTVVRRDGAPREASSPRARTARSAAETS